MNKTIEEFEKILRSIWDTEWLRKNHPELEPHIKETMMFYKNSLIQLRRDTLEEVRGAIIHKYIMTPSQVHATYGLEVKNPVIVTVSSKDIDFIN